MTRTPSLLVRAPLEAPTARRFASTLGGSAVIALLAMLGLSSSACRSSDSVLIGAVLPLTGDSAIYGAPIAQGIELAFEQLKGSPGMQSLQLKVVDSKSDPATAKEELEALYDEGARAVIGGVTTPEALAMVEIADAKSRVLVSPSASAQSLTGISRNFYRVWPSDSREGGKMGQYAAQSLNIKSVVILAADSPYAEGIQMVFKSAFEQNGGKVLEQILYPSSTSDLTALVERAISLNPEAVFLADYASPVVEMIQQLRQKQFPGRILTVSAFATPQSIAAAGTQGEGVFVTQPQFSAEDETATVKSFVEAYRSRFKETPSVFAAHGFDSMQVIGYALRNGGDSGTNFWKGMRAMKDLPGVTGLLQFDEKGDVTKYPKVYFVLEGRTVDHDAWVDKKKEELARQMQEIENARRRLQQNN